MTVLDEIRRNGTDPAFTDPQCSQRTFVKKRVNLCNRNVQELCDIGQGQPFAHKAFYITHGSRLPCRQALRLVGARLFNGQFSGRGFRPERSLPDRHSTGTHFRNVKQFLC